MSAAEIIEQIKQLPRDDQERVFEYLNNRCGAEALHDGPDVRYMDARKAKTVSAEIFSEHAGLFRKLAS